jgi:hypothetical protein
VLERRRKLKKSFIINARDESEDGFRASASEMDGWLVGIGADAGDESGALIFALVSAICVNFRTICVNNYKQCQTKISSRQMTTTTIVCS